jgi:hypothetical protein
VSGLASGGPGTIPASAADFESDTGRLVLVCVALGAGRAPQLLDGLAPAVRARARACLRRLVRSTRAERHARLALAFASPVPRQLARQRAADLPGALGRAVREALDSPGSEASSLGNHPAPLRAFAARRLRELLG